MNFHVSEGSRDFRPLVIFPSAIDGTQPSHTAAHSRPEASHLFARLLLAAPLNYVSFVGRHHPVTFQQLLALKPLEQWETIVGLQSSANKRFQKYGNDPL
jgi:hypothetical protein